MIIIDRRFVSDYSLSNTKHLNWNKTRQEQRIILKETFTGFQQTQTFSVKLKTVVGNGVYKICKIFFPRVSILNLEEAPKFRFNIPFFLTHTSLWHWIAENMSAFDHFQFSFQPMGWSKIWLKILVFNSKRKLLLWKGILISTA